MQLRSSHAMTDLSHMNAKVYETLEAETGQATGFKQNGTLAIARNDDRMHELKRYATIAKSYGIGAELISPREAVDLYPGLEKSVVKGALIIPKDGQLNAVDTVMAFMAGARKGGARAFENSPVTGIEWGDAGVGYYAHTIRDGRRVSSARAFLDPNRVVQADTRHSYGEERFQVMGRIEQRLFVIVYTPRRDAIRIISARKANQREVRDYENRTRED